MRAISLWQPWASAIILGSKRIETRRWPTKYRGPVVIHAAQRFVASELTEIFTQNAFLGAVAEPWAKKTGNSVKDVFDARSLPYGALLGTAHLIDCVPTDSDRLPAWVDHPRVQESGVYEWTERDMGNYESGRFAWLLEHVTAFAEPVPFKGKQGWFAVSDELIEAQIKLARAVAA